MAEDIGAAAFVGHAWHTWKVLPEGDLADRIVGPGWVWARHIPDGWPGDRTPHPDHLAMSRFVLRELTGLLAQQMGF